MKVSLKVKILILLVIVVSPVLFVWSEYQRFMTTPVQVESDEVIFTVQRGANLSRISQAIYQQGLSDIPSFYLDVYGRLQGNAHLIKAGEYRIRPGSTLPDLLEQFIEGRVVQYPITIVEGMTSQQLLDQLAAHPKIRQTLTPLTGEAVIAALGKSEETHPEGWFLPETYHFPAETSDIQFLKRAHRKMVNTLDELWQQRADNLPYKTPYEALIMASIIEKESGVPDERPQIAGVFVRRLEKGMRLQTDPTVIYGMGDRYEGVIRRSDLTTDTPYNTYTRFGLPPTPIALPSRESIEAALHPADGDALYFVATGEADGRHTFSATLEEHNRAVRVYRQRINER